jgi:hypothetical protein
LLAGADKSVLFIRTFNVRAPESSSSSNLVDSFLQQDIQDRLQNEIDQVIEKRGGDNRDVKNSLISNDEVYGENVSFFNLKSPFYQVRQGRTWSRSYKSPSPPPRSPPTRFRILIY